MTEVTDPLALTRALIRCPSVTPEDAGALGVVRGALDQLGFTVTPLTFQTDGQPAIHNLFARRGTGTPHLAFAGHTDVVPPGAVADWSAAPFEGDVREGVLIGRGAVDMKGAIGAFIAATARFVDAHPDHDGSISLIITGDEEGPAIDGTRRMVAWMRDHGIIPDHCLVGEPTNPDALGDMIKVGRRGSLNARLTIAGTQGHVAYPHLADNPIPALAAILDRLSHTELDDGTEFFDPSSLQVTTVDVDNPSTNVIPARAEARFNIRFNDLHSKASLDRWLNAECDAIAPGRYALETVESAKAFMCKPDRFHDTLKASIEAVTGMAPELSTTGGTSDARFLVELCPVAEFGLVGRTMHKIDEQVPVDDLHRLSAIYEQVLNRYFQV